MNRIGLRPLNNGFKDIIEGDGTVRAALIDIFRRLRDKQGHSFQVWKLFTFTGRNSDMQGVIRAHRLRQVLDRIPARTQMHCIKRIIGDGDLVKGVLKSLDDRLNYLVRDAVLRWKVA